MSKNTLDISPELQLPLDAATKRLAWVGTVGSGKTYGASKTCELMLERGIQCVILDPVGVWWGLRLGKDGKSKGVSIPVFGGMHGDIPLEPTSGNLIADLVVDKGISVVLDVSQFEHDTDKARFAADFGNRFFFRKKAKPSAVHLWLEEAQEFVPQNPQKGEERMLHAYNRIWKIGRNFGIGGSIISQRPQEVNKKALNLSQCLFAFQTLGTHERKAIEEWMKDKALDIDMVSILPKLKVGQPHVWSPAWLDVSNTITIREKRTFNASSTPEVGVAAEVKQLAPIDLEQLSKEMAATVERAKASDPKELQKRIRELEGQLKKPEKAQPNQQLPSLSKETAHQMLETSIKPLRDMLVLAHSTLEGMSVTLRKAADDSKAVAAQINKEKAKPIKLDVGKLVSPNRVPILPAHKPTSSVQANVSTINTDRKLGKCERSILSFLASSERRFWTIEQVAIMTKYSVGGGGFGNALGVLASAGLIERANGKTKLLALPEGFTPERIEFSVEGIKEIVGRCEREIIRYTLEHPEGEHTVDEVAANTFQATGQPYAVGGGGFGNALGKLSSLGFITRVNGKIRLSDDVRELL